jgi:cell division protein FtsB
VLRRRTKRNLAEAATLLARNLDPVAPPQDVRERIVGTIQQAESDDDDDDLVVDSSGRFRNVNPWWLATAATLFLALWGWRELAIRAAKARIHDQEAQIQQLDEQNALLQAQKDKLSAEMSSLANADTRTIALTGQAISPSASARVFLEPAKRRAVVFFYNLPENGKDKSYQLWVIRADQPKPQSAGVFDVVNNGRASLTVENLPVATEIKALAVTLEPHGGVEQPTNTNFFVMGNGTL